MKKTEGTLPASFKNAEWHGTTPHNKIVDRQGISFDLESGEVIRLGLSPRAVRHVVETLQHYLQERD